MASSSLVGGLTALGAGSPPLPDLKPLAAWMMTGFSSSTKSLFLVQFSLALSGGIPVPPLSTDQGALPAGQGYS